MSDDKCIIWLSRSLSWGSAIIAAYWSNFFPFSLTGPYNWKLYGMFAVVGILSGFGGHLRGWIKGYRYALPVESE